MRTAWPCRFHSSRAEVQLYLQGEMGGCIPALSPRSRQVLHLKAATVVGRMRLRLLQSALGQRCSWSWVNTDRRLLLPGSPCETASCSPESVHKLHTSMWFHLDPLMFTSFPLPTFSCCSPVPGAGCWSHLHVQMPPRWCHGSTVGDGAAQLGAFLQLSALHGVPLTHGAHRMLVGDSLLQGFLHYLCVIKVMH